MKFTPRASYLRIRRREAARVSAGGIVLPEGSRERPSEGTVVACGPGPVLPRPHWWEGAPPWMDQPLGTTACEGDVVLFEEASFRTLGLGPGEGLVPDDELVALQNEAGFWEPLSDFVMIHSEGRVAASAGGVEIPGAARPLPLVGTILAVGPGRVIETGPLAGLTRSVAEALGLPPGTRLSGQTVHWDNRDGFLWIKHDDDRDALLVRAGNLVAIETPDAVE